MKFYVSALVGVIIKRVFVGLRYISVSQRTVQKPYNTFSTSYASLGDPFGRNHLQPLACQTGSRDIICNFSNWYEHFAVTN